MIDSILSLLSQGYAWLPDLTRTKEPGPVRTRLLGKPAIALRGPAAVSFFYDEGHVERQSALPEPVLSTLFGKGAVHTLDGATHRQRKDLFVSLLKESGDVAVLAERVAEEWDRSQAEWAGLGWISLFDETSLLLTRAVCRWAGIPLTEHLGDAASRTAQDLVAMVDGFATAGPRHWQARHARRRQEQRLAELIEETRRFELRSDAKRTALHVVAEHRDADGESLSPRTAAVELLNIIRPAVAITWYVTFGAHALHRHPEFRAPLATERQDYARAFAHEVRRFYPFAPFAAGVAPDDVEWHGEQITKGTLVLLDLYGQNHDPDLWDEPYTFDPERFVGREPGRDELVPQGGGEAAEGHRCPGEDITLAVLSTVLPRLARLTYTVPEQDLRIPLGTMPTRPRSGFLMADIRER